MKEIQRLHTINKQLLDAVDRRIQQVFKQTAIKIVSFANGTDDEILALVNASLNGKIDLYSDCGWRVGDERTISLPAIAAGSYVGESHAAQSVTIVLTHHGKRAGLTYADSEAKDVDGQNRNYPAFEWDFKNSFAEAGYMNNTNTNNGSWNGCRRKLWIDQKLVPALPEYLVKKNFTVLTATSYNGTTTTGTTQKASLRAAKEVFGGTATAAGAATSYSNLTEFNALEQIDWYKTASHRVKKRGGNASEQSSGGNNLWLRSPYYNTAIYFCTVIYNGTANYVGASNTYGLSPFGCIG